MEGNATMTEAEKGLQCWSFVLFSPRSSFSTFGENISLFSLLTVPPFTDLFLQEAFLKSLLLVLQSASREPSIHPSPQRTWSVLLYSLI